MRRTQRGEARGIARAHRNTHEREARAQMPALRKTRRHRGPRYGRDAAAEGRATKKSSVTRECGCAARVRAVRQRVEVVVDAVTANLGAGLDQTVRRATITRERVLVVALLVVLAADPGVH